MSLNKKEQETKGIRSTIILEIIGKPPEHLIETLEEIIKKIDEEKGVRVIDKKINEPILMKDNKEFYTTFAEVNIEVEEISYLAIIMFKYMPAHVEVIEPELIALTNNGWTDILSELTRRLHGYDEIARILQIQNSQMQKKLQELLPKNKEIKEVIPEKEEIKKDIPKKKEANSKVDKKKKKKD
jgi:membrane protein insertase Oxa1/YidC/SpoIIIJ